MISVEETPYFAEWLTDYEGEIIRRDSDDIQDVKQKDKAYRDVNDVVQQLRDIAHVWLGSLFGLQNSYGKPMTDIEYQNLLAEVTRNHAPETWEQIVRTTILRTARELADIDNRNYTSSSKSQMLQH